MIKRLLSTKELLLAVVPGEDGQLELCHARVNGRRILKAGDGAPAYASDPIRAAIFSPESFFEQAELAAATPKLLPLVARRHVDGELIFDQPYRLRALSRSKGERSVAADIVALPEADFNDAVVHLPMERQPCLQLVPLELSIAALVGRATKEPVIVFWEKGGTLLSLLVVGGMVQSRMRERVSDDNRKATIGRAEASLRARVGRHGDNREVFLILYTGELCDQELEEREKAAQAFEKKLNKLYRGGRGMPKDAVLRDPELYGLPYVSEDWSFVEEGYREQVKSWRYAKPAALLAGMAGIAFGALGAIQHLQALTTASDFDDRQAELRQTLNEIQRIKPSDEDMAIVRNGLQIQLHSFNEVRLDRMLGWLTNLVPEGVIIRSLHVEPAPPPSQARTRGAKSVTYAPGQKPFLVNMEVMLAETTLDAAEASAAEVLRRLSQRLQMVDTRLDVPAPEPGVRRNVVLMVKAQAKAESF